MNMNEEARVGMGSLNAAPAPKRFKVEVTYTEGMPGERFIHRVSGYAKDAADAAFIAKHCTRSIQDDLAREEARKWADGMLKAVVDGYRQNALEKAIAQRQADQAHERRLSDGAASYFARRAGHKIGVYTFAKTDTGANWELRQGSFDSDRTILVAILAGNGRIVDSRWYEDIGKNVFEIVEGRA